MTNLATAVLQLRKERDQARKRIEQMDQVLEALTGRYTRREWTFAIGLMRPQRGEPCQPRHASGSLRHSARAGRSGKPRKTASNPNPPVISTIPFTEISRFA